MDNVPEANRFAPPTSHVDDIVIDGQGALAGRGARLVAVIIDGILNSLVLWIVTLLPPFTGLRPKFNFAWQDRFGGVDNVPLFLAETFIISFVIYLLLQGYLLQTRGQTIGKMLLKIRIVRSDGTRASLLRLVGVRYLCNSLLAFIPFVGGLYGLVDALMIFRESRKCVHDNIADTIVVKA